MKPILDFSILDGKKRAVTPVDEKKEDGQYKTTPNNQNASQRTLAAFSGVQQLKLDISQGIKAGADPYPLLLKAVQAIATMTNDRAYYTAHKDIMQGMGMLEQTPSEWEREAAETSVANLEAAKRNIAAAIAAHRKRFENQPAASEAIESDEYNRRIKRCFEAAYKFLDDNKHIRTEQDWERVVNSIASFTDPLAVGLIAECVNELERDFRDRDGQSTVAVK